MKTTFGNTWRSLAYTWYYCLHAGLFTTEGVGMWDVDYNKGKPRGEANFTVINGDDAGDMGSEQAMRKLAQSVRDLTVNSRETE